MMGAAGYNEEDYWNDGDDESVLASESEEEEIKSSEAKTAAWVKRGIIQSRLGRKSLGKRCWEGVFDRVLNSFIDDQSEYGLARPTRADSDVGPVTGRNSIEGRSACSTNSV
jgi:hypothetical protein